MPEGDTIWRAAERIRRALQGRVVEAAASSAVPSLGEGVRGSRLEEVDSRGKHLLLHFANGLTVHSHLGMQGRWRVTVARQAMTPEQAGAVLAPKWLFLESGTTRAVCERAPVIELLSRPDLDRHPVLKVLGPDVLVRSEMLTGHPVNRARMSGSSTVGELLLNQRVLAGIGNIYRNETLFVCGVNPFTEVSALDDEELMRVMDTASRLMTSSLKRRQQPWVYRRAGLACRRCGELIRSAALGASNRRTVYWCPHCQPQTGGAGSP